MLRCTRLAGALLAITACSATGDLAGHTTAPGEPCDAPPKGNDQQAASADGIHDAHEPASTAHDAGASCDAGAPSPGVDAGDGPDASDDGGGAPPVFDCEAYVEVGQLLPTTCAVVDPVSRRVGHLEWVCAGGPARLSLDGFALSGTVDGDVIELAACRDDPVSWLYGRYETVRVAANLATKSGALTFGRGFGESCARVFPDCSATAAVVVK